MNNQRFTKCLNVNASVNDGEFFYDIYVIEIRIEKTLKRIKNR
jgi:hypothetical protein